MAPSVALAYVAAHLPRFVAELVRFPTVSAQPRHAHDIAACVRWLARHLAAIGLEHAQATPTPHHPLVYADWLRAPGRPTVLIYSHYDVQPADPLDEADTRGQCRSRYSCAGERQAQHSSGPWTGVGGD